MARWAIRLNVVSYACLVAGLGYDTYRYLFRSPLPDFLHRLTPEIVNMRLVLIVPTVVCLTGLLRRTRWGLDAAVGWDLSLGFLFGAAPFIAIFGTMYLNGDIDTALLLRNSFRADSSTVAVSFLILGMVLRRRSVREHFGAHA